MVISALVLVILDIILQRKTRKVKNLKLVKQLETLSKSDRFKSIRDKPDKPAYIKMQKAILKAGLHVSPDLIKLLSYMIPLMVFSILVLIQYTNVINSRLNIDQLREVSKYLGDDSIANVDANIEYGNLFMYSCVTYFVPTIVLKLLGVIRDLKSQSEVLMLQTYAIILLKTGQSVKYILIVLHDRATLFRPHLEVALKTYSENPNKALNELKISSQNVNFEKIVLALEQAIRFDRRTSVNYLEQHRKLGKELNRINKKTRDSKKKIIGLLMLIVPLATLMAIGGYPWLLFSLKVMNDMPF